MNFCSILCIAQNSTSKVPPLSEIFLYSTGIYCPQAKGYFWNTVHSMHNVMHFSMIYRDNTHIHTCGQTDIFQTRFLRSLIYITYKSIENRFKELFFTYKYTKELKNTFFVLQKRTKAKLYFNNTKNMTNENNTQILNMRNEQK